MTVVANIHEAKTTLSKLLEQVQDGEDVVIARAGKPVARLVRIKPQTDKPPRRVLGQLRGKIRYAADWDDPATNAEVSALFYDERPPLAWIKGVAEE